MKVVQRRAVSPIVATLLLIVISVVSGLTVYIFTQNLSGSIGSSGGGQQLTELITLDAYTFSTNPPTSSTPLIMALRNSGSTVVTVSRVYFDGAALAASGSQNLAISSHGVLTLLISTTSSPVADGFNGVPDNLQQGTAHQVRVVTVDGATFTFSVIAGGND